MTQEAFASLLRAEIAAELKVPVESIDVDKSFTELGLDSLNCIYILHNVEQRTGWPLNPSLFWDFPTIRAMAGHVAQLYQP